MHLQTTVALFYAPAFDQLRRQFAAAAGIAIAEDETDEARDCDYTDLRDFAAKLFRAGELCERSRSAQPLPFPERTFEYTLGSDPQPLASAIDAAAQAVRDEEDADHYRTEATVREKRGSDDYSHISALSTAMAAGRRFPERILQDLPPEHKALRFSDTNFELRELLAFCFRAGQLSGWR